MSKLRLERIALANSLGLSLHYDNMTTQSITAKIKLAQQQALTTEQPIPVKTPRVILTCVRVSSKLRIRFHSFIDENDTTYTNVYNNNYNCTFPKDIRVEGRYYEIPHTDITLNRGTTSPFYNIKRQNIKILECLPPVKELTKEEKLAGLTIYKNMEECCICMCEQPNIVFLPCGHQCACVTCYNTIKLGNNKCPLCRRGVEDSIIL
jgi:hypothetical protein